MINFKVHNSSLIHQIIYDSETEELTIKFKKYYVNEITHIGVKMIDVAELTIADSVGSHYLHKIKTKFKIKKSEDMPDKIINLKINVKEIKKEWLFTGEKGTYLNMTLLYNEQKNDKGQNGMIVQDVPSEIYKANNSVRGPILGNAAGRVAKAISEESKPGVESGKMGLPDALDDLPF